MRSVQAEIIRTNKHYWQLKIKWVRTRSGNKDIPPENVVITTKDLQGNTILKVKMTDIIQINVNNIKYSSLV